MRERESTALYSTCSLYVLRSYALTLKAQTYTYARACDCKVFVYSNYIIRARERFFFFYFIIKKERCGDDGGGGDGGNEQIQHFTMRVTHPSGEWVCGVLFFLSLQAQMPTVDDFLIYFFIITNNIKHTLQWLTQTHFHSLTFAYYICNAWRSYHTRNTNLHNFFVVAVQSFLRAVCSAGGPLSVINFWIFFSGHTQHLWVGISWRTQTNQ